MTFATTPEHPIHEARRHLKAALRALDYFQASEFEDESIGLNPREALITAAHNASLAVTAILEAE